MPTLPGHCQKNLMLASPVVSKSVVMVPTQPFKVPLREQRDEVNAVGKWPLEVTNTVATIPLKAIAHQVRRREPLDGHASAAFTMRDYIPDGGPVAYREDDLGLANVHNRLRMPPTAAAEVTTPGATHVVPKTFVVVSPKPVKAPLRDQSNEVDPIIEGSLKVTDSVMAGPLTTLPHEVGRCEALDCCPSLALTMNDHIPNCRTITHWDYDLRFAYVHHCF